MIRLGIFIFAIVLFAAPLYAQQTDTLSNLPNGAILYAPKYNGNGQWGYILGQNSAYRQQFAEKYSIEGSATIKGIVTHLVGTFTHPDNYVEFNVYEEAPNGLPGSRIGGKQLFYKDLDLSGDTMTVTFSTPLPVQGSFFVTFNVLDYLHGGYEGDTLGLMVGEPGSRSESDLQNFGRNAIQAHNHTKEDWKDFYTQNFTPIATHFALFPIIEMGGTVTGIEDGFITKNELILYPPYPNPATKTVNVKYTLNKTSEVSLQIYDIYGRKMYQKNLGTQTSGEHEEIIDVDGFTEGAYLLLMGSGTMKLASKIIIK